VLYRNLTNSAVDDAVLPQDEDEKQLYSLLSDVTGNPSLSFASRWREPSLTIHSVTVSGPGSMSSINSEVHEHLNIHNSCNCNSSLDATVIPGTVRAKVSIRIVPDQNLETIAQTFREYLQRSFKEIQSPNTLEVSDALLNRIERKCVNMCKLI